MSNDARSLDTPETILLCGEKESVVYVVLIGVDWYNCTAPSSACGNDVELFKQWLDGVKTNKKVYCMTLCREDLNGFSSSDTQDDPNNPPSHDTHDEFSDFSLHHIIDKKLDYVIPLPNENDKLIIVFSGHGFEAGGDSYLAPGDLIVTKHGEYDVRTAISYRELTARLNKCKAKFKWLIINACRDEVKIIEDNSLSSLSLDSSPDPKNCVVLRSCQSGEKSWTNESVCKSSGSNYANELIYSIFIWYLVDALDGAADSDKDGKITMKDVIEYVTEQTQIEADRMGVKQTPWNFSSFSNLEDVVIISKKTEGMTPEEFKKGQELISKAQERFNVAKEQEPKVAIILLEQALKYVNEALKLIPKPPEKEVNPKDGKHKSEWKELLRKIDNLKNSKEMSMAQPSSRKEVDSRIALDHQDLTRRLVEIQNVLPNVPQIQPPVGDNIHTDKRNSRQPQEQNIDPYDEYKTPPTKDQKIETLDNQNSQQNENQRLPLKDDNIQQTNVSKKDIRPDENQMKNGESDSAE
ncbi:MAG: caspase domain-containing protein [Thermoguttaceae bacterium]